MKKEDFDKGMKITHMSGKRKEPDIKSIHAARRKAEQDGGRKRKKHRRRNRLFLFAAAVIILAAAILLPLTMFFNIQKIEVEGTSRYTSEQIASSSGVSLGENLFRISASKVEERITRNNPYIESVTLKRILPTTLRLDVVEATPAYCLSYLGNEMVISSNGKVLEAAVDRSKFKIPQLKGAEVLDCEIGEQAVFKDEIQRDILLELVNALEEQSLLSLTDSIDVSELYMLRVGYQNRLSILLGNSENLAYKFQFAKYIITSISSSETGTVDVSDIKRASFRPGKRG